MKITFTPVTKFAEECLTPPIPAKQVLPSWFRKTPFLMAGEKNYTTFTPSGNTANATMKGCSPFLDALSSGYVFCLSADVEIIKKDEDMYVFNWRTENTVITQHGKQQHPFLPNAFNGLDMVLKFHNDFIIQTPKGYSTYFTHPVNRTDLPFRTFTGIVETDSYRNPVHFPFQLMHLPDDITILEKGTPICHFIPFKRDNWTHNIEKHDTYKIEKHKFDYFSKIYRAYKSLHWVKKRFD